MSKQKIVHFITTRLYEIVQQLSIATYVNKMDNKYFEFEPYFEMTYEYSIKYSLECLDIKDNELYRDVYKKYLYEVYELSLESVNQYIRFATLNRHRLDEYWVKNKNEFLKEIVHIYDNDDK